MEIILTYRGRIPSRSKDRDAVWAMRREFHDQLLKLWGREPFAILKRWDDSAAEAGAPVIRRNLGNQTFLPLLGKDIGVGADIDITLLTGQPSQKRVLSSGDLDNRVKRLVDALRAPQQDGELVSDLAPNSTWHCLLEDDDVVTSITAKLGVYLASNDPAESFAFIRVRPTGLRVSLSNIAMLL